MTDPIAEPLTLNDFYRVVKAANSPAECGCDACALWTITYREYGDLKDTELGQSWQGAAGKVAAEDVCSLMNMAYEQALELPLPASLSQLLNALQGLCVCSGDDPECLYCESRLQIEVQARALDLAQARISDLQQRVTAMSNGGDCK